MVGKFACFVLSFDVWFYFSHLLLHTNAGYVYIHWRHHAVDPTHLTYADAHVVHVLEGPLQCLGVFFPMVFFELDLPVAVSVFLFLNVRGLLRHDARMAWLVGNHHILHHQFPQYNFGDFWLDSLMGTRHPDLKKYTFGCIYN